ncbi:Cuticle Protein CPR RR Uncl [Hyalella azteca]|uniref:Cuticle Protein CPR RR Uncl n=1 Tax=Hyalella azteca TaxID=294128 RepID=A0A6A0HAL1_HYAAZ|nr:Cuticle Protein CPR RR Uncl [Hyalella azteca]
MLAKILVSFLLLAGPALSFPNERALAHFGITSRTPSPSSVRTKPRTYTPPPFSASYSSPPESKKESKEPESTYTPPQVKEEEPIGYSYTEPVFSATYPARTPYRPPQRPEESREDKTNKPNFVHKGRSFAYEFDVRDGDSGNQFAHQSQSDGEITTGMYTVQLPDGRLQTVKYSADADTGFQVNVEYQGVPFYPDDKSEEVVDVYKLSPKPTYTAPATVSRDRDSSAEKKEEGISNSESQDSAKETNANSNSRRQKSRVVISSSGSSLYANREETRTTQGSAASRTYQTPLTSYSAPAFKNEHNEEQLKAVKDNQETVKSESSGRDSTRKLYGAEIPRRSYQAPLKTYTAPQVSEEEITEDLAITYSRSQTDDDSEEKEVSQSIYFTPAKTYGVPEAVRDRTPPRKSYGVPPFTEVTEESEEEKNTRKNSHFETAQTISDEREEGEDLRATQPLYSASSLSYGVPSENSEKLKKGEPDDDGDGDDDDSEDSKSYGSSSRTYGASSSTGQEIKSIPPRRTYGVPEQVVDLDTEKEATLATSYGLPQADEEDIRVSSPKYSPPSQIYGVPDESFSETLEDESKESATGGQRAPSRIYGSPDVSEEEINESDKGASDDEPSAPSETSEAPKIASRFVNRFYSPPKQTYGVPDGDIKPIDEDDSDEEKIDDSFPPPRSYETPKKDDEIPNPLHSPPRRTYGVPDVDGKELVTENDDDSDESADTEPSALGIKYGAPDVETSSASSVKPPPRTYGIPEIADDNSEEERIDVPSRTYGVPDIKTEQPEPVPPKQTYGIPEDDEEQTIVEAVDDSSDEDESVALGTPSRTYGVPEVETKSPSPLYLPPRRTYGVPQVSAISANENDKESDEDEEDTRVPPRTYGVPEVGVKHVRPVSAASLRTYAVPKVTKVVVSDTENKNSEENEEESYKPSTAYGAPEIDSEPVSTPSRTYGVPEVSEETTLVEDEDDSNDDGGDANPPSSTYGVPEVSQEVINVEEINDDSEEKENVRFSTPARTYGTPEVAVRPSSSSYLPPKRTYGVPQLSEETIAADNAEDDSSEDSSLGQRYSPPRRTYSAPAVTVKKTSQETTDDSNIPSTTYGAPEVKTKTITPIFLPPQRTYGVPAVSDDKVTVDDESDEKEKSSAPSRTYGTPTITIKPVAPVYFPPRITYDVPKVSDEDSVKADAPDEEEDDSNEKEIIVIDSPSQTYGTPQIEHRITSSVYVPPSRTYGVPDESVSESDGRYSNPSRAYGTPNESSDTDENEEKISDEESESSYQSNSRTEQNGDEDVRSSKPLYSPPSRSYGAPNLLREETQDDSNEDTIEQVSTNYGVPSEDEGVRSSSPIYLTPSVTYGVPILSAEDVSSSEIEEKEVPSESYGVPAQNDPEPPELVYEAPSEKNSEERSRNEQSYSPPRRTYGVPETETEDKDNQDETEENSRESSSTLIIPQRTYGAPEVNAAEAQEDERETVPEQITPSLTYGVPFAEDGTDSKSQASDSRSLKSSYSVPPAPESSEYEPLYAPPARGYTSPSDNSGEGGYTSPSDKSGEGGVRSSYSVPPAPESSEYEPLYAPPATSYTSPSEKSEEEGVRSSYSVPPAPTSSEYEPLYAPAATNNLAPADNSDEEIRSSYSAPPAPESSSDSDVRYGPLYAPPSQTYGTPKKNDSEETISKKIRRVRFRATGRKINRGKPSVYYQPKPVKVVPSNNYRSRSRHARQPKDALVSYRPTRYESTDKHLLSLFISGERR